MMTLRLLAAFAALTLAACAQTAPIYSPPPGGHDALSVPPSRLLPPGR